MSSQKDIIVHNDDATSVEYVLVVLDKVFGIGRSKGLEIAKQVDQTGSSLVFTGDEQEVLSKLELIRDYNEATSNTLKFTSLDAGVYQAPQAPQVVPSVTQGDSLTLQFKTYGPEDTFELLGQIVQAGNLNISPKEGIGMAQMLAQGCEVVLKDFEDDPKGKAKAQMLLDVITDTMGFTGSKGSDFEEEEIDNIVFSVRSKGYTLLGPKQLISEDDMARNIFAQGLGDLVQEIESDYEKDILKKYGNIENFKTQASSEELEEYQSVQESLQRLDEKMGKPKGMGRG